MFRHIITIDLKEVLQLICHHCQHNFVIQKLMVTLNTEEKELTPEQLDEIIVSCPNCKTPIMKLIRSEPQKAPNLQN